MKASEAGATLSELIFLKKKTFHIFVLIVESLFFLTVDIHELKIDQEKKMDGQ